MLRSKKNLMRESLIQKVVCDYAISKGFLVFRVTTPTWPDRGFIRSGKVFMMEFKATGKVPRKSQAFTIKKIKGEKIPVYIVDDIEVGKKIIDLQ